ncbi:MAG: rhodanese-like domain-containing protein [Lautropia sp.]|nr:rhodanese-like domain-containing protein [Lautropia sp.]
MQRLSPHELAEWLAGPHDRHPFLLDVREEWEFELAHLPNSVLIPLGELNHHLNRLPIDRPVVIICHHGVRSLMAGRILSHHGLEAIYDLRGGIDAWSVEIDRSIRRY